MLASVVFLLCELCESEPSLCKKNRDYTVVMY